MLKRSLFWFGLLLGSLTAYGSLRKPSRHLPVLPVPPLNLTDFTLTGDALVVCDSAGAILHCNNAAQVLFGPQGNGYPALRYPSGQAVPPGQHPLSHALRSENKVEAEYLFSDSNRVQRTLGVSAHALPGGGAAALFRDLTADYGGREQQAEAKRQQQIVRSLCLRLNKTAALEESAQAITENTHTLFLPPAEVQVRLYIHNPESQTLTQIASQPADHPKQPKSAAQRKPSVFPFDVQEEALWQIYLLRRPSRGSLTVLGEPESRSAYALPLVAGGVAIGHLGLFASSDGRFDDPGLQETLQMIASVAALALTVPKAALLASALSAQADAVHQVTEAVAAGTDAVRLADLVATHIRRITGAAVCTLSLDIRGKLTVIGEAYQDDLLLPHTAPNAPALHGKAVQKAWRTQKIATQIGSLNPLETGPWRALAGKRELHLVTALPLASRLGVLTVYSDGTAPLPAAQIKFIQTLTALSSLGLRTATAAEDRAEE